jgi:hypothetical protein
MGEPNAVENAIGYAKLRVSDSPGNVIDTREHNDFKKW